ncbi:MAG: PIN domain-containing protein [Candidatus Nanohalobium sp.]
MILDTNFLIDLLEDREDALEKLKELRNRKEPLMIPPGALYKLYTGLDSKDKARTIENKLNRAEMTPAVEKEAARIRKKLNRKGEPIGSIDYLIAGTARHLNEKILTNDQHFNRVEDLQVEEF